MKIIFLNLILLQLLVVLQIFPQRFITNDESEDRAPKWSPDGKSIVFESNRDGNWEIYTVNIDNSGLKRITENEADDRRPSWHPDSKNILFESNRGGRNELYTINLLSNKTQKIEIKNFEKEIMFAKFSPDGKKIAFSSDLSENGSANFNIFIVDASGNNLKQITYDSTRSLYPEWSKDGKKIYFFSRRDTENKVDEIYSINLSNNQTDRITNWPTHNFAPALSPDQKYLVCATSIENSRPELFIVDLDSKLMNQITSNDYGNTEPDWSSDGNSIVYASYKNGNYDICIINRDEIDKSLNLK